MDFVSVGKHRFALSRLRLSSDRLEVETGRWARPNAIPFEERRCTSCHSLEDGFHFVLECYRYNDLRTIYIYLVISEEGQTYLSWLNYLNPKTKKTQINLCLFVFKAFKVYGEQFVFG